MERSFRTSDCSPHSVVIVPSSSMRKGGYLVFEKKQEQWIAVDALGMWITSLRCLIRHAANS